MQKIIEIPILKEGNGNWVHAMIQLNNTFKPLNAWVMNRVRHFSHPYCTWSLIQLHILSGKSTTKVRLMLSPTSKVSFTSLDIVLNRSSEESTQSLVASVAWHWSKLSLEIVELIMILVEEMNMLWRASEGFRDSFHHLQSGFQVDQSAGKSFPCTGIRSSVVVTYKLSYAERCISVIGFGFWQSVIFVSCSSILIRYFCYLITVLIIKDFLFPCWRVYISLIAWKSAETRNDREISGLASIIWLMRSRVKASWVLDLSVDSIVLWWSTWSCSLDKPAMVWWSKQWLRWVANRFPRESSDSTLISE